MANLNDAAGNTDGDEAPKAAQSAEHGGPQTPTTGDAPETPFAGDSVSAFSGDMETTIPPHQESSLSRFRRDASAESMPEEFDDYRVIEEIARGGMGIVYRVHQKSLDREVALKTVLAGRFASDDEIRMFRTEARAAGKLNHPGIVPVYDVGESHGFHYFSMPLIDGISLGDRLSRGPIDPDEAAAIMKSAAETIQFAHDHNVVHRDLKPGNILVDAHGQPLITDFGIAHSIDDRQSAEQADALMGTAEYMSPEQASGEAVGPPGDVYSLGATLYCLLTGRPPFQSSNPLDTLLAVLQSEPVPPRRLNERIPRDLELICLKCMEKRPENRYASAQEIADELGRFLTGEPVLVHPVGNVGTFIRWTRRQPRMAALATGLVVSFTAALVISVYYNFQLNMQRAIALEAERSARLSEAKATWLVEVMSELTKAQEDLTRALEYSALGDVCAAVTSLSGGAVQTDRRHLLEQFQKSRSALSEGQQEALRPLLDRVEETAEGSLGLDAELVEQVVSESRALWRSSTEDSASLRTQIRTVLYSRAQQLLQEIVESGDRVLAGGSVESLLELIEAELTVVADDEIYTELQGVDAALRDWYSGPPPEELEAADGILEQALALQADEP